MSIYADGNKMTDMFACTQALPRAFNFTILQTTQVVAIEVESNGVPSIIGSFSDSKVTNSNWKCTSDTNLKWEKPGFNDSLWKSAVENNGDKESGTDEIIGILPHAKWIRTAEVGQQNMYCRFNRVRMSHP